MDKPLVWIGSSKDDLSSFPVEVKQVMGYALRSAQQGGKHAAAKMLKGFGGSGVVEVVENDEGGTYRAVYTVKFAEVVYVLHAFKKKSKKGIATPQQDMKLIRERLKCAENHYVAASDKKSRKSA